MPHAIPLVSYHQLLHQVTFILPLEPVVGRGVDLVHEDSNGHVARGHSVRHRGRTTLKVGERSSDRLAHTLHKRHYTRDDDCSTAKLIHEPILLRGLFYKQMQMNIAGIY